MIRQRHYNGVFCSEKNCPRMATALFDYKCNQCVDKNNFEYKCLQTMVGKLGKQHLATILHNFTNVSFIYCDATE
jgi:hypothetical protein